MMQRQYQYESECDHYWRYCWVFTAKVAVCDHCGEFDYGADPSVNQSMEACWNETKDARL